jgi:hypothetical protein
MKTKIILFISILLFSIHTFSQQIGDGFAPSSLPDFTLPLNSGMYGYPNPIGSTPDTSHPWQHLLVIRHGNPANNFQLQIGSAFASNDRLFFRKLAGGLEPNNPTWIELATRGTNSFIGDQYIVGNLGIGTINPIGKFDVRGNVFIGTTDLSIGSVGSFVQIDQGLSIGNTYSQIRAYSNGGNINNNLVLQSTGGNVGIGTTNPTSKLTVAGDINSREVKVTVDAGADFVFEKDYNLPSLASLDTYIKENKHLPEIASAKDMQTNGINLSEMNIKLLQKVEELTLYAIEQNKKLEILQKENNSQSKEIVALKRENETIKTLSERLSEIENKLKATN